MEQGRGRPGSTRHIDTHAGGTPIGRAGTTVVALAALVAIGVVLARSGWGLDRTDEGQYLLLLTHPEDSRATVFLFGYVLHPLFEALGRDIVAMRVAGVLLSVLAAGGLGLGVSRVRHLRRTEVAAAVLACAAAGVGPLLFFPPTPSYNTLAFWGACLWGAGAVLATLRRGLAGPVMLGAGGVVTFLGKVTSGAALAVLTVLLALGLVALAGRDRASRAGRLAAGVTVGAAVAGLAACLLVGHGPMWFADTLARGARNVALLQGHEHVLRWDPLDLGHVFSAPAAGIVPVFVGMLLSAEPGRRTVGRTIAVVGALAMAAAVGVALVAPGSPRTTPPVLLGWWLVPLCALAVCDLVRRRQGDATPDGPARSSRREASSPTDDPAQRGPAHPVGVPEQGLRRSARAERALAGCVLALVPLAYVVGTNGNYWVAQTRAGVFWLAAGILLVGTVRARRALLVAAALWAAASAVLATGYGYRYLSPAEAFSRQVQAGEAPTTRVTSVSPDGARLRLTPQDAAASDALARIAAEHHLDGVPFLDVTGASPGYIRQLGGRPVGSSWLLGGYPGSLDAALDAVRDEDPAVLRRAWVLDAPDSPRRIDGLLEALGRSVDRDYVEVATVEHQLGYKLRILRPVETGP